jgi:hypothetical protein
LAKNVLLPKLAAGWTLTYLVLVVLLLARANLSAMVSASLFFLVGAIVGFVSDISQQSIRETAVEDYGLSRARAAANVLISGVSAVLGVALVAVLGVSVLGNTLVPTASAAGTPPSLPNTWPPIFDWRHNLLGLVAAVAFGFAPSRLFDLLRTDQSRAVQQLKVSQSTGTTAQT